MKSGTGGASSSPALCASMASSTSSKVLTPLKVKTVTPAPPALPNATSVSSRSPTTNVRLMSTWLPFSSSSRNALGLPAYISGETPEAVSTAATMAPAPGIIPGPSASAASGFVATNAAPLWMASDAYASLAYVNATSWPTITAPTSSSRNISSQSCSVHCTALNTPGSTSICMSLSSSTMPRPPTTKAFLANLRVFRYAAAANAAEKISSFSTAMPSCSNLYTYCLRLLLLLLVTNTSRLPCSRSSAMDSRAPGNSVSPCQMTPSQSITMQSTSARLTPSSRSSASAFAGSARGGGRRAVAAPRRT
mmetsp:Transcript_5200/g.20963  ORF Transcript_5200/g.20963 Transcript_5200/m.20963 type:complete len:307 (-) Transcript_5200:165-1085(-)